MPCLLTADYHRLPNVGTDLLITVNAPYPDDETAAASMADAETFSSERPVVEQSHTPEGESEPDSGKPVVEQAPTPEGESEPNEALAGQDEGGVDDKVGVAPKGLPQAAEAGIGGRRRSVEGSAGVSALRSLLRSFKILDWSLFC